ncbi:MAG: hypothetical protein K8J31_26640, partial [Anaerolineae bacterium]|nr:hypothetical protein [Anaerolineae bacterium]
LLLPIAALLGAWLTPVRLTRWIRPARWIYGITLVALALPGMVSTLYDSSAGWDWLWNGALPDDSAKYRSGNAALMWVVDGLQKWADEHPDEPLVVAAPGIERLRFFFPLADIRVDEAPTRWDQLAGVTYFIDSAPEGRGAYGGIPLEDNQVLSGLALATEDEQEIAEERAILRRAWWKDDGFFSYTVYELHLENRLHEPSSPPIQAREDRDVSFGGFVRFLGHDIGGDYFWPGRRLVLRLYWEVLTAPDHDYTIYIHLRDANGQVQAAWDGPISRTQDGRYYSSLVWEPGEFIVDYRRIRLPEDTQAPPGEGYQIVIGLYDAQTNTRVPVAIDGEPAGDGYVLPAEFRIVPEQPG